MDVEEIREKVRRCAKVDEVHCLVAEFHFLRQHPTEDIKEVTVRLWDMGPEQSRCRYYAEALDEDGRRGVSNSVDSIDTALSILHWHDLDGPLHER